MVAVVAVAAVVPAVVPVEVVVVPPVRRVTVTAGPTLGMIHDFANRATSLTV